MAAMEQDTSQHHATTVSLKLGKIAKIGIRMHKSKIAKFAIGLILANIIFSVVINLYGGNIVLFSKDRYYFGLHGFHIGKDLINRDYSDGTYDELTLYSLGLFFVGKSTDAQ